MPAGFHCHVNLKFILELNCYNKVSFVIFFVKKGFQFFGFNKWNSNFFLENLFKIGVRIIYGCALYTDKYGSISISMVIAFIMNSTDMPDLIKTV